MTHLRQQLISNMLATKLHVFGIQLHLPVLCVFLNLVR